MKTTSKDDELRDKIYDLAEVNVENNETGEELYAIAPEKLVKFIKQYGEEEAILAYRSMFSIDLENADPVEIREIVGGWIQEIKDLQGKQ